MLEEEQPPLIWPLAWAIQLTVGSLPCPGVNRRCWRREGGGWRTLDLNNEKAAHSSQPMGFCVL